MRPSHCARFDATAAELCRAARRPCLVPVLQQRTEGLLRQRQQTGNDILSQVQASIQRNLADQATLAVVARNCNLTVRTLQRKLAQAQSGQRCWTRCAGLPTTCSARPPA